MWTCQAGTPFETATEVIITAVLEMFFFQSSFPITGTHPYHSPPASCSQMLLCLWLIAEEWHLVSASYFHISVNEKSETSALDNLGGALITRWMLGKGLGLVSALNCVDIPQAKAFRFGCPWLSLLDSGLWLHLWCSLYFSFLQRYKSQMCSHAILGDSLCPVYSKNTAWRFLFPW